MPPDSHSNGNKYWENVEEQPGRTRWVDFKAHDYDSTQIDPLWHAWLSHTRLEPPSEDPLTDRFEKSWQQVRLGRGASTAAGRGYRWRHGVVRPSVLATT